MTREESPGVVPPSAKASSASRTCRASRSGSAYTATLVSPASLQARATRTAISPRLAIRTFCTALSLFGGLRTVVSGRTGGSAAPEVGEDDAALGQLRAQGRERQADH